MKNKQKHPLFRTWHNMKQRCTNANSSNYKYYGGRGVSVCEEWLNSFDKFVEDMGERPNGYTLDRIDSNKGYYKENCRWATKGKQADNRSYTRWIAYGGTVRTLTEWAELIGMDRKYLYTRIFRLKWSVEDALTKPIRDRRSSCHS